MIIEAQDTWCKWRVKTSVEAKKEVLKVVFMECMRYTFHCELPGLFHQQWEKEKLEGALLAG